MLLNNEIRDKLRDGLENLQQYNIYNVLTKFITYKNFELNS
jgi:hypothetical protein